MLFCAMATSNTFLLVRNELDKLTIEQELSRANTDEDRRPRKRVRSRPVFPC